jgi:hypothetical protein
MTIAAPAINIDVKVDKNGKNSKDEVKDNDHKVSIWLRILVSIIWKLKILYMVKTMLPEIF